MPCEIVTGESFPRLEEAVLETILETSGADSMLPKWVVTPTPVVSNHIRSKMAQLAAEGPIGSVRCIPLESLWGRLKRVAFEVEGKRWDPSLDFLLFEAVSRLPSGSRLSALRNAELGYTRLRETFLDLADGGFGQSQASLLHEWLNAESQSPLEAETIGLYAAWLSAVESLEFAWEPILHQRLAEWIRATDQQTIQRALAAEGSDRAVILIHGFYDFTDVNLELIAALGKKTDLRVFIPYRGKLSQPHPAYAFCKPVLEELSLRLGSALARISRLSPTDRLDLLPAHFIGSFPEGNIPSPQPDEISYQRASGVRAEILSAAVRVRKWIDEGIEASDILIVSSNPSKYSAIFREVFGSFYIPFQMQDIPVAQTPDTRPLSILGHIWEERAPAEWILAYLSEIAQLTERWDVDGAGFEAKIRELPLWGGDGWIELSTVLCSSSSSTEGLPRFSESEKALIKDICDLWVNKHDDPIHITGAIRYLQRIQTWLEDPSLLQPLVDSLVSLADVLPNLLIPQAALQGLFRQSASGQTFSDLPRQSGVKFVPLMRSRGLSAKALVILGLSTLEFPPRIEEDAFFSDQTRLQIAKQVREFGHRLPVKAQAREEMSLLFLLINTSADRIHWVIPETDENGRSVAPAPWVQRYLRHWDERQKGAPFSWERIPVSPSEQAHYLYSLDPKGGAFLPPDFALILSQELSSIPVFPGYESLDWFHKKRRSDPEWNGNIKTASFSKNRFSRVSVTQLESLARCPYSFYASHIASLEPVRILQVAEATRPQPITWGRLIHASLEQIFAPCQSRNISALERASEVKALGRDHLENALQPLIHHFSNGLRLFHPIFKHAYAQRLLGTVFAYLDALIDGRCVDGTPQMQEVKIRVSFPEVTGLKISGQVDRIDLRNGSPFVIDYKSGKEPNLGRSALQREVDCGFRLQPILYPWLSEVSGMFENVAGFAYIFLGHDIPKERTVAAKGSSEDLLQGFAEILTNGGFYPTSGPALNSVGIEGANTCQWCEFASLCRRYDPAAAKSAARLFRDHSEKRCTWLASRIEEAGER